MANTLANFANLVRGLASLAFVGLLGGGGWIVYQTYNERIELDRALAAKTAEIERLEAENDKLALALRLLKVDHRVAQIDVLDQQLGAEPPTTTFQFTELSGDGQTIGKPKEFTIKGDVVYLDAWVIKYSDDLVRKPTRCAPLRFVCSVAYLANISSRATVFRSTRSGRDPRLTARAMRCRRSSVTSGKISGAMPTTPAKPSVPECALRTAKRHRSASSRASVYRIELRASAGLSIVAEDVPADTAA